MMTTAALSLPVNTRYSGLYSECHYKTKLHDHVDHLLGAAADSMRKVCVLVLMIFINGGLITLGLLAPPV